MRLPLAVPPSGAPVFPNTWAPPQRLRAQASTFPIDTPNHEHGHYDDDEDIDEEAPTGDTDITAT